MNYHTGDIVHVAQFPYEKDIGIKPKGRYGIVIHNDKNENEVYIMGITSRHQRTQQNNYKKRSYEVEIPESVSLYGVVRTDMFRAFDSKDVRYVKQIDNETLYKINDTYKQNIYQNQRFTNSINQYCPNHKEIMSRFSDELIANKLNFLSESNRNYYEELKNQKLQITELGKVGNFGRNLKVYDLTLETKKDKFNYRYTTEKSTKQMLNLANKQIPAKDLLHSDFKFKVLNVNIRKNLKEDKYEASNKEPVHKIKKDRDKGQGLN